MRTIEQVADHIRGHRCYSHPIFRNWAAVQPSAEAVGALFHQIQNFCASTRPGGNFPAALGRLGYGEESLLFQEIVESESDHGPELAAMAGFILNRAAGTELCPDLGDRTAVEAKLKEFSDRLLGRIPGYDPASGLTIQARKAISVFARRERTGREDTLYNLGAALALEIISNRHLIPGEKHCLVDSGLYGADFGQAPMHYLLEHWGEIGAEQQHEANAFKAVAGVLGPDTEAEIMSGVNDMLDSLASLWDVLDASLLQSGWTEDGEQVVRAA